MFDMKNLWVLVLFAFSGFFQKPPGGARTAAKRHMRLRQFLGSFYEPHGDRRRPARRCALDCQFYTDLWWFRGVMMLEWKFYGVWIIAWWIGYYNCVVSNITWTLGCLGMGGYTGMRRWDNMHYICWFVFCGIIIKKWNLIFIWTIWWPRMRYQIL